MALPRIDPDPLSPLNQMQKYLVNEFVEDYHDGLLSRRDLMAKIGHIAGGAVAATAILTWFGVSPDEASAQDVATPAPVEPQSPISIAADDPSILATDLTFMSGDIQYMAYEVRPAGDAATPKADTGTPGLAGTGALVLVCHENRGLTDHIRDVTRRLAAAGYVGVAIDLLSPEGGTSAIDDQTAIPGILTDGDINRHVVAFQDVISHYQSMSDPAAERVGMMGFCFGGGITWQTATQETRLLAGVPFYGPPPPIEDVPNMTAAMLGVYSEDSGDFANEGRDELVAALEAAGVTYEIKVYPGTEHAFNNDTGQRYNEEQALAAWNDTLAWLAAHTEGI